MAQLPSSATPRVSEGSAAYLPEEPVRLARLFRNGANQAVRIPKEFELPGKDVLIRQEGKRLVIEAVQPSFKKGSPQAILAMLDELAQLGPMDEAMDDFPDVDAGMLPLDTIDLGDIDEAPLPQRGTQGAPAP